MAPAPNTRRLRIYARKLAGRTYPELRLSGRFLERIGVTVGDEVTVVVTPKHPKRIEVRKAPPRRALT